MTDARPVPPAPGMASHFAPPRRFVPFYFPWSTQESSSTYTPVVAESNVPDHQQVQEPETEQPVSTNREDSNADVFEDQDSQDSYASATSGESGQESGPDSSETRPHQQVAAPVQRQRSGSYPPQAHRPGNTNDWSRRDHSVLRNLGNEGRPRRATRPPAQLTYDEEGKQKLTRTKRTDL